MPNFKREEKANGKTKNIGGVSQRAVGKGGGTSKLKLEQVEHKMNRLKNKIKTESKKQRDARTYALCYKAGHLEAVFPVIKDSGKIEFVQFVEGLAALPEVKEYAADVVYRPVVEVGE